MSRYFCAIAPPEPLIQEIEAFRGRWGHPHHRVEPHITMKAPFLWREDPTPWLRAVGEACLHQTPFTVRLGAPGRFPGARVLFLSATGDGLEALHQAVTGALHPLLPPEPGRHEQEYHPHLTLAAGRFGIDAAGLDEMEAQATLELGSLPSFEVCALRCYHMGEGDARWLPFKDLPLGG